MAKNKASRIFVVSFDIDYEGLRSPEAAFKTYKSATKYADARTREEKCGKYERYVVNEVKYYDE